MRSNFLRVVLVCVLLGLTALSYAQLSLRKDCIWARSTAGGTMTLDGVLNEPEWAKAESLVMNYGQNMGDPTSGWNVEGGIAPTDPTHAIIKFLADPAVNKMYIGFTVNDSSVGGRDWAQFDQLILSFKDRHWSGGFRLPAEMFAGWGWNADSGNIPSFDGRVGKAVFTVDGISNSDLTPDVGYTVEISVNLDSLLYNANSPTGEVVEMNFSLWDADWNWPNNPAKFSSSKTWWQSPWNGLQDNVARVFIDPAVTVNTVDALATPEPDVTLKNGEEFPTPNLDGKLDDAIWSNLSSFDIHYGDSALRESYPSIGKWRSGQWQPTEAGTGTVVDPGNASVRWFFKGDILYVGVDVNDESVQSDGDDNKLDGIQLSMTLPDETKRTGDHKMSSVRFGVRIDSLSKGGSSAIWDLTELVKTGGAWYNLTTKGTTTIDDPSDVDEGYSIELAIDLTRLGYAPSEVNKMLLLGFGYHDGDKFTNSANDYGTRTWWFREWPWGCAPAWCLLDNNNIVTNPDAKLATRQDYIWARSIAVTGKTHGGGLTLDGKLDETEWSQAESLTLNYGENAGDPTSGWNVEGGIAPTDPTQATVKFLSDPVANKLYLGFTVKDSSIGGRDWAQFDQLLMSIKNRHWNGGFRLPAEMFAGWGWDATPGVVPAFNNWVGQAVYNVQGTSNDDATPDTGYTVEVMFNLDTLLYNANNPNGDVIELNFSIWDADWNWPNDPARFSSSKCWWQNGFNDLNKNVARVFVNPNVTINTTTALAEPEPDVVIQNGADHPSPTVDGNLAEGIWSNLPYFDIRFGDSLLRETYPNIGKWRSGEWQPVEGGTGTVVDPGNARVKWYFKGDKLYVGVDISDESVQSDADDNRLDGFQLSVTIPADDQRNSDHTMKSVRYGVRVDSVSLGGATASWDLPDLITAGGATYGLKLKGTTTIDDPSDVDEGYTIELCIDLTKIGYQAGAPNKMLLLGAGFHDGDKFTNSANDYGTRTWWFREWPWGCAPAWCLLEEDVKVSGAVTASIALADKWNLVSVPITVNDYSKATLFPTATSNAFAYVGGYNEVTTLENGAGYWLRVTGDQNVTMDGTVRTMDTLDVLSGWNLIGSISYAVPVANILSIPSGLVTSNFFGYADGYEVATNLEPGKGYWVKVTGGGKLLVSTSPALAANKIKIVPTSELPPAPPSELNEEQTTVPSVFAVYQNYPNPFNPSTIIRFSVPEAQRVTMKVFDVLGREVMTLLNNEEMNSGEHYVQFNGSNLASGLYYYRVQAGTYVDVRKMILTK